MVSDLLNRLEGVRATGQNKWRARCPSCGGKNTTKLAVRELSDGRVLVHCFAGCDVGSVLEAAGVQMDALFPKQDGDFRPRERKPWTNADLHHAFSSELAVAWVLLRDLASGRVIGKADRERAAIAAERCAALMAELA